MNRLVQSVDLALFPDLAGWLLELAIMEITQSLTPTVKFSRHGKHKNPNYQREINWALSPNANSLQVAKYKLCKQMLIYQKNNKLSDEKIAQRIKLSVAEVEDILFCEIEKFTLDRLVEYAERLFSPEGVKVVVEPKKTVHTHSV